MSMRPKRPIKFRSLFKEEATEKDIQMDLRKMQGALQKIKLPRTDKAQTARVIRDAVLNYVAENARHVCSFAPTRLIVNSTSS